MPKFYAIDTETSLIPDRPGLRKSEKVWRPGTIGLRDGGAHIVRTGPYTIPDLMVWTAAGPGLPDDGTLRTKHDGRTPLCWLERLEADPEAHIVFHNAPFDIDVIARFDKEAGEILLRMADQGRIHDTKIADVLIRLADGVFDRPRYPVFTVEPLRPRTLQTLAKEYCDIELNKDNSVRCGFHEIDLKNIPPSYSKYAKQDAVATLAVWNRMLESFPDDGTYLSEPLQVRAALVIAGMDRTGVHIDQEEAQRLLAIFSKDMPPLESDLVRFSLGEFKPKAKTPRVKTKVPREDWHEWACMWSPCGPGLLEKHEAYTHHSTRVVAERDFHMFQGNIRERLAGYVERLGESVDVPRTPSGALKLDAEWWKPRLEPDDAALHAWCKYERLKKIVGTYLNLYSKTDRVFPRWNLLVRSGRMSCAAPNAQNVPKRKYALRSLYVPKPDHVFIVADYAAQEMYCLAETMLSMGITGPLLKAVESGQDIHRMTAAFLADKDPADVTDLERQGAKACNFGIPGGLGAARLRDQAARTYKVDWSLAEAKAKKALFLAKFYDIAEYLSQLSNDFNSALMRSTGHGIGWWRRELGLPDRAWIRDVKTAMRLSPSVGVRGAYYQCERSVRVRTPTGRVRYGCSFTEGANSGFQALGADVIKQAAWNAMRDDFDVVLIVHDELVAQVHRDHNLPANAEVLCQHMKDAFVETCPTVGPYAKVDWEGPLDKWGEAKDKDGNLI